MKILLIDNYDSFTFNLYHYLSSLKAKVDVIRNDKITSKQVVKKKYDKIVISPGPGNPNQAGNCISIVKSLYKKNSYTWCMFRTPNNRSSFWIKDYRCQEAYAW